MYRDDEVARAARASALIDEIAALERQRLAHASREQRLASARRELAALETSLAPTRPLATPAPGLLLHLGVFATAAGAAFIGYALLF